MRYFIRQRGQDDAIGPFSVEEITERVRRGQLARWDMVLADSGQTSEQLKNHWDFKWEPWTSLLAAAASAQVVTSVSRISPVEEHRQALDVRRAIANKQMIRGALWCGGGIAVTAITYSMAADTPSGGSFVVAWGAIAFGFLQFMGGLTSR